MNEQSSPIDHQTLDRLVDGELSTEEYRQVLSELEGSQDGWRRCAHAFLEAQALGNTLPLLTEPARFPPKAEPAPAASLKERESNSFRGVERLSAMAASVAIAFGLGWYISTLDDDVGTGGSNPSVQITDNNPVNTSPVPGVQHEVQKPKFVYVNQWDGQNTTGIPIPVDPDRPYDPQQPWDESVGISAQELQKLKDEGRPVETYNRLIPVTLDNGNKVVVPMQEVIVHDKPELPFH